MTTLLDLFGEALWVIAAMYATRETLAVVSSLGTNWLAAWRDNVDEIETTKLKVAELRYPTRTTTPAISRSDIQLPDDLDAYANEWNDEWARDDVKLNIREKFLELHNGNTDETWQKVRRAIGIGELP